MANPILSTQSPVPSIQDILKKKPGTMGSMPKLPGGQKLDTLLKANQEAALSERKPLTDIIDIKNAKLKSLEGFQTLVQTLYTVTSDLRGDGYSLDDGNGIFSDRSTTITAGSPTAVGLEVNSDAYPETIAVTVTQLAKQDAVMATNGVADSTVALGLTGDLVIQGITITLDAAMNLTDIQDAINLQTMATSVRARILPGSVQPFALAFSMNQTGVPITIDSSGINFNGHAAILPTESGQTINDLSAVVSFRGFPPVSYSTNIITNQGDGLTFSFQEAGSTTFSVGFNISQIYGGIASFAKAYNDLAHYTRENSDFTGLTTEVRQSLYTLTQGLIGGQVDDLQNLEDMGLKFQDGYLILEDTLLGKIQSNPQAFKKAFDFSWSCNDPRSSLIGKPDIIDPQLLGTDIVITTTMVLGTPTPTATINGTVYNLVTNNQSPNLFQGQAGTLLEGYSFSHTSPLNTPVTYRLSQGIGSQLLQALGPITAGQSNSFRDIENKISTETKAAEEKLAIFDAKAEKDQDKFRTELTRLAQLLQYADMIKLQLESMFNSR